ncbi:MAG TPA: NADH-quinone oxidoreductase subunit M [Armatimonadota bacterium]|nr:NADH-quinone oxidoreductase subunit M [Armatimonadota bacterium]
MGFALLNCVFFVPLIAAFAVLFIPRSRPESIERWAFGLNLIPLALAAYLWITFASVAGMQDAGSWAWIPEFNIRYSLGVDGFSMPMVFLTCLLSSVCIFYSAGRIVQRVREYYFFMLLLECFLLGVFLARDLFLFYALFDASLVPMYFLIALWGGERRAYAAMKFFLYTLAGSAAMLIGLLWVYFRSAAVSPVHVATFDIATLAQMNLFQLSPGQETILFFLFGVAFAVKIPIAPLHTWLPDAYVEAPTAVTVMLAGAMGKMGVYGFLRIALPFFPHGAHVWATPLMILGVISIVYGAFVALAQWDIKRLVAYSSVSHMGFIVLGLAAAAASSQGAIGSSSFGYTALSGVVFEMFAHGLITGSLFLLIGILEEQAHLRDLLSLTGAMKRAPIYVIVFATVMFASMGMPGLMGFWGELYVLLGAFSPYTLGTAISALGIIITAGFFIWTLQRMALGITSPASEKLADLSWREVGALAPLILLMFIFGIFPAWYISTWMPTIQHLMMHLGRP